MAIAAPHEADHQRHDRDADGEVYAKAPPLPCHALALLERGLQRADVPLELGLACVVSRSCEQCHQQSLEGVRI